MSPEHIDPWVAVVTSAVLWVVYGLIVRAQRRSR